MGKTSILVKAALIAFLIAIIAPEFSLAQQSKKDIRPLKGAEVSSLKDLNAAELNQLLNSNGESLAGFAIKEESRSKEKKTTSILSSEMLRLVQGKNKTNGNQGIDGSGYNYIKAENGSVRWMSGNLGTVPRSKVSTSDELAISVLEILDDYTFETGLTEPKMELRLQSSSRDEFGYNHIKFQQVHKGIPVWASELYAHIDASGDLYAVNGSYNPTSLSNIDSPALSTGNALQLVQNNLQKLGKWKPATGVVAEKLGLNIIETQLVYYTENNGSLKLAYEIKLHPNIIEQYTYLIDAESGDVLKRLRETCSLNHLEDFTPSGDYSYELAYPELGYAAAGSFVSASGTDLNGIAQNFRVFKLDGGNHHLLWDLPNIDLVNADPLMNNLFEGGAITLRFISDEAGVNSIESTNNDWSDSANEISAHVNMFLAYNYYRDTFSRKAIDDNNETLISVIDIKEDGQEIDNAFWNGRLMMYGNGDEVFKPLAGGLDVAGHEMTHGVIQHTANLVYEFQSGALNESFADVFGVLIENKDFLIGDDIMLPGAGVALRDLLNPDNPQVLSPQPAHMDNFVNLTIDQDNGGVHVNSGIPNRAAALIMQRLGNSKTENIYYRALSNYLTRNSSFFDARLALVQAAEDLHGAGSNEVNTVSNAFDAVGIVQETSNTGGSGGGDVNPVAGGRSLITFISSNGTVAYMDVTDPGNTTYTEFNNAFARIDVQYGSYTQLSTPLLGGNIWFIGGDGYLKYVQIETGDVYYYPDVYINQQGDLWNAVIAPDESFVAFTSAYASDPRIYFYGEQGMMGYFDLIPEIPQQGVQGPKLENPDVISWTTDSHNLKIAFDALRLDRTMGFAREFWGIYELDFSTGKIFEMIPNFSSDYSLGNITYSKTNVNVLAFNEFNNNTFTYETYIVDFRENKLYNMGISNLSLSGNPLLDVQRPSFSPDDSFLVLTSFMENGLFFIDLNSFDISYFNTGYPVFAPHWFMSGGQQTTDILEDIGEIPNKIALHRNYPNPFNPNTVINFDIPESAHVKLEIFDAVGRKVATLIDAPTTAGSHEVNFNASNLSSGLYIARLSTRNSVSTLKMTLIK